MGGKICYVCGKENLDINEIGLTKKLLNRDAEIYYCLSCLCEHLEVDADVLLGMAEEFKAQGCKLF